jgi:uncharacterized protein YceK
MIFRRLSFFLLVSLVMVMVGCNATVRQQEEEEKADMVYMDYQATGDEEGGEITVRLQFRYGGPEGDALLLDTPASVHFDGQLLLPDSSKMGGAFYEVSYLAKEFGGLHEILFKDGSARTYTDTFRFPFFSLSTRVPGSLSRAKDLELEVKGVGEKEVLHVMLTDTSFYGRGLDRVDTVMDGKLLFTRQDFSVLKSGPVHLEFYREEERRLQKTGRQGGRLYLSYSLSREFMLID